MAPSNTGMSRRTRIAFVTPICRGAMQKCGKMHSCMRRACSCHTVPYESYTAQKKGSAANIGRSLPSARASSTSLSRTPGAPLPASSHDAESSAALRFPEISARPSSFRPRQQRGAERECARAAAKTTRMIASTAERVGGVCTYFARGNTNRIIAAATAPAHIAYAPPYPSVLTSADTTKYARQDPTLIAK